MLNDIWLKILPKHFCVFATVWHSQTYSSSVVLCLDGSGGRKVLRRATTTMIPSWVRSIGGLWCVLDGNQTWCLCLEWDTLYSAGVVDWWASPWFGSCPNFQSNGQWLYRHAGTRETIISSSREISTSLILSATETLDFWGKMAQGVVNKKRTLMMSTFWGWDTHIFSFSSNKMTFWRSTQQHSSLTFLCNQGPHTNPYKIATYIKNLQFKIDLEPRQQGWQAEFDVVEEWSCPKCVE